MDFSGYVNKFIDNSRNITFVSHLDYRKIIDYETQNYINESKEFYFTYDSNYNFNNKTINDNTIEEYIMDSLEDNYNSDTDTETSEIEFEYYY